MKLNAKTVEIDNTFNAVKMGMNTSDPAVIQILLESIYPDPYVWPRELLANWMDAGGGGSLELPDKLNPLWIIEDHGEGMTDEFMQTRYAMIFESTKRDSDEKTGGFGHGRLSPLAYTDTYNVRSRYFDHESGVIMEGNYVVFKGEDRIPQVARVSFGPSEVQQTGVTVSVPIGDGDIAKITARTLFFASYLPTPPKGFASVQYSFKSKSGGQRDKGTVNDMNGARLVLGGVPYPAPSSLSLHGYEVDIFFEVSELSPTLSREAINADQKSLDLIKARFDSFIEEYKAGVKAILDAEPSLLDRYVKFNTLRKDVHYQIQNSVFKANVISAQSLGKEEIAKVTTGDFNIHSVLSDVGKTAYGTMDVETKTLRSLRGLQIKSLTGAGVAQRRSGILLSGEGEINFQDYLSRSGFSEPQIMLFAIKLPYSAGQITLIRGVIAAQMSKARKDKTFGNKITALLIQYEKEEDLDAIAKLISPKLKVNIITDTSARTAGSKYVSVVKATDTAQSKTQPIKLSELTDPSSRNVFMIRKAEWTAWNVNDMFDTMRRMEVFKDKVLIMVHPADAEHLPKGYASIQGTLSTWLSKNYGYTTDLNTIRAHLKKTTDLGTALAQTTMLFSTLVAKPGYRELQRRDKLITVLQANELLMKDKVISDYIKLLETAKAWDSTKGNKILNVARDLSQLSQMFDVGYKGGTRPLPEPPAADVQAAETFKAKYPFLDILKEDYHMRNYGIKPDQLVGIIDYMESKNRNCK